MNRRGFLSTFLKGAITAAAAPQIITHGLGLIKPRLIVPEMEINPDWVNAPREVKFIFGPTFGRDSHPLVWKLIEEEGFLHPMSNVIRVWKI